MPKTSFLDTPLFTLLNTEEREKLYNHEGHLVRNTFIGHCTVEELKELDEITQKKTGFLLATLKNRWSKLN